MQKHNFLGINFPVLKRVIKHPIIKSNFKNSEQCVSIKDLEYLAKTGIDDISNLRDEQKENLGEPLCIPSGYLKVNNDIKIYDNTCSASFTSYIDVVKKRSNNQRIVLRYSGKVVGLIKREEQINVLGLKSIYQYKEQNKNIHPKNNEYQEHKLYEIPLYKGAIHTFNLEAKNFFRDVFDKNISSKHNEYIVMDIEHVNQEITLSPSKIFDIRKFSDPLAYISFNYRLGQIIDKYTVK